MNIERSIWFQEPRPPLITWTVKPNALLNLLASEPEADWWSGPYTAHSTQDQPRAAMARVVTEHRAGPGPVTTVEVVPPEWAEGLEGGFAQLEDRLEPVSIHRVSGAVYLPPAPEFRGWRNVAEAAAAGATHTVHGPWSPVWVRVIPDFAQFGLEVWVALLRHKELTLKKESAARKGRAQDKCLSA